jgi:azurin
MNPVPRLLWFAICGLALFVSGCGRQGAPDGATGRQAATPPPASGRPIEVTGNDAMKCSGTEIRATPGEALSVTLVNIGTMPKFSMGHNWVLLTAKADLNSYVSEAALAPTTDYLPQGRMNEVIAHTKLLGPNEKDTVTFHAPKQPGRYPFICSFPGHFQVGMRGELIVE